MAAGFGTLYLKQLEDYKRNSGKIKDILEGSHDDVFDGEGEGDENRSPYEVGLECRPVKFALLFSNFADKFVSFKVGVLWRNTGTESLRVAIEQCNFSVGGMTQDANEVQKCSTITVPPGEDMVQVIGGGWSKILWSKRSEREAVRGFLAGSGNYKDFNASREYWAAAYFSATYKAVGTMTGMESEIMSIANEEGVVRYLSHRNISEFDRLMQATLKEN